MQILFWIMLSLVGLFICLCIFMLVYPCHYIIEGNRQEKFQGFILVNIGFFIISLSKKISEGLFLEIFIWKWRLINTEKQDLRVRKKNKKHTDKQVMTFRTWLRGLNRERFSLVLEIMRKVWRKICPQVVSFNGRIGFTDPYYTGLMAALLMGFPRNNNIDIKPDFSRPICEFSLQMEGQFSIGTFLYHILHTYFTHRLR